MSVFDEIRSAAAAVMERARSVRLDEARLEVLARGILGAACEPAQLDPAHHYRGSPESTLAFVVTLDAINFGSGWFPLLTKRPGCSGYFTVATALTERFEACGPFDAQQLQAQGADEVAALLGQDLVAADPALRELMALFARALADLGRWLEERHGGDFARMLASASHRAETLVQLLAEMPFYRDVARYDELEVPFYKRAQLTAADLAVALRGEGFGRFDDLDRLTIFADNLVPHVLWCEGVLRYVPELVDRIAKGELLETGSPEEVEIRAGAVHAVERMVALLLDESPPDRITAQRLDYVLWNRGQRPDVKARPRHRARSVYY